MMTEVVMWGPVLVLGLGVLLVSLVAAAAVLLVCVSVACAAPGERGRAAVRGAR